MAQPGPAPHTFELALMLMLMLMLKLMLMLGRMVSPGCCTAGVPDFQPPS